MTSNSGNNPSKTAATANGNTTMASPYEYALKPGCVIAGCRIVQPLGHGGMGEVYLADHIYLKDRRAIKIIRPDRALRHASSKELFLKEGQLQTQLKHSNVIQVFDMAFDETYNVYYLVMEFVDGESVGSRLKEIRRRNREEQQNNPAYTEREALEIVLKVAETLGEVKCDKQPVVHRDIKPDNIMLTTDGNVKVADWGIATLDNADAAPSSRSPGTPGYMAPELTMDKPVRPHFSADIYALGVTLYEMLANERPFQGSNQEVWEQARTAKRPDIRQKRPAVSSRTAWLIKDMMAKSPKNRPESWEILAERIQKAMEYAEIMEKSASQSSFKRMWLGVKFRLGLTTSVSSAESAENEDSHDTSKQDGQPSSIVIGAPKKHSWREPLRIILLILGTGAFIFVWLTATMETGVFKQIRLNAKYMAIPQDYHASFQKTGVEPPFDFINMPDNERVEWIGDNNPDGLRYLPPKLLELLPTWLRAKLTPYLQEKKGEDPPKPPENGKEQ